MLGFQPQAFQPNSFQGAQVGAYQLNAFQSALNGVSWPDPSLVRAGVKYGPTGTEYTGTYVAAGSGQIWLRRR